MVDQSLGPRVNGENFERKSCFAAAKLPIRRTRTTLALNKGKNIRADETEEMFEGTLQRDEGKTDSIDKNSTRELQQQTCLISHSPLDGSCAFITRFCRSSTRQHSFVDKNATRQAEISVGENPSLTFVGRRRQETCWLPTWKQRRQQFDWRHLLTDLTFSTRRTDGWLTYSSIRG